MNKISQLKNEFNDMYTSSKTEFGCMDHGVDSVKLQTNLCLTCSVQQSAVKKMMFKGIMKWRVMKEQT